MNSTGQWIAKHVLGLLLLSCGFAHATTIVCLGDSNSDARALGHATWCEVIALDHPDWTVFNAGKAGGKIVAPADWPTDDPTLAANQWSAAEAFLDGRTPDAIVLAFGTNDIDWTRDPLVVADGMERFRDQLETHTGAPVFLADIPPRYGFRSSILMPLTITTNHLLRRCVPYSRFIRFHSMPQREIDDSGVHWSLAGQERRARRVERAIRRFVN